MMRTVKPFQRNEESLQVILQDISQLGTVNIDEICRKYDASQADISWVRNRLVAEGLVQNVAAAIVTITPKGREAF
jgi:hypothetical protein